MTGISTTFVLDSFMKYHIKEISHRNLCHLSQRAECNDGAGDSLNNPKSILHRQVANPQHPVTEVAELQDSVKINRSTGVILVSTASPSSLSSAEVDRVFIQLGG